MKDVKCCNNCLFYKGAYDGHGYGPRCCKHAPVIGKDGKDYLPEICDSKTFYCGDWEKKDLQEDCPLCGTPMNNGKCPQPTKDNP